MTDKTKSILVLLAVPLIYVFLGIASRLLERGFEPFSQVAIRITIGTIVAWVIFRKKIRWRQVALLKARHWLGIALMGILGYGLTVYFLTRGVLLTKLANVSVLYATFPFFVIIYSALLLKTKPKLTQVFLVVTAFYGVVVMSTKSLVFQLDHFGLGEIFILCSALVGGWYVIGRKMVCEAVNNFELTVLVMLVASVCTWILTIVSAETIQLASFLIPSVLLGVVLGSSLNILASFCENYGFQHLNATFASQLLLTESIFAFLLGYLFYGETISWLELVGALIVVTSVYFANKLEVSE